MKFAASHVGPGFVSRFWLLRWVSVAAILAVAVLMGCGSNASPVGNTSVTLLSSSTANDRLLQFSLRLTILTLTSQSGNTVSLLAAPLGAEFIHVNGTAEPLATVG